MHRFSEGMYFLFLQHCLHSSQSPHSYWGKKKKRKLIKHHGIQFQNITNLVTEMEKCNFKIIL